MNKEFGDPSIFSMGYEARFKVGAQNFEGDPFGLMEHFKKYMASSDYVEALTEEAIAKNKNLAQFIKHSTETLKNNATNAVRAAIEKYVTNFAKQKRLNRRGTDQDRITYERLVAQYTKSQTTEETSGIRGLDKKGEFTERRKVTRVLKGSGNNRDEFVQMKDYLAEMSAKRTTSLMSEVTKVIFGSGKGYVQEIFKGTGIDDVMKEEIIKKSRRLFQGNVDHIMAMSIGGGDSFQNQQVIPASFNQQEKNWFETLLGKNQRYIGLKDETLLVKFEIGGGRTVSTSVSVPFSKMKIIFVNIMGVYIPMPEAMLGHVLSKLDGATSVTPEGPRSKGSQQHEGFRRLDYDKSFIRASLKKDFAGRLSDEKIDAYLNNVAGRFRDKFSEDSQTHRFNQFSGQSINSLIVRDLLQGLFY